jgi:hypothetical protein
MVLPRGSDRRICVGGEEDVVAGPLQVLDQNRPCGSVVLHDEESVRP